MGVCAAAPTEAQCAAACNSAYSHCSACSSASPGATGRPGVGPPLRSRPDFRRAQPPGSDEVADAPEFFDSPTRMDEEGWHVVADDVDQQHRVTPGEPPTTTLELPNPQEEPLVEPVPFFASYAPAASPTMSETVPMEREALKVATPEPPDEEERAQLMEAVFVVEPPDRPVELFDRGGSDALNNVAAGVGLDANTERCHVGPLIPTIAGVVDVGYWRTRQDLFKDEPGLPDGWIRVQAVDQVKASTFFFSLQRGEATMHFDQVTPTPETSVDFMASQLPKISAQPYVATSKPSSPARSKRGVRVIGHKERKPQGIEVDVRHWWYRQDEFKHLPVLPEGWLYILSPGEEQVCCYWMATGEVKVLETVSMQSDPALAPSWV